MKKMRKSASNVNNAVNLISGAYTLPLIDKLFSNSQRIENMDDVYFAITALVDTDRISEAFHMIRGLFGISGMEYPQEIAQLEKSEELQESFVSEFIFDFYDVIEDMFFASTFSSKMQIDFLKVAWGISPVLHFLCRHSFRCRRGAVAGIQSLLVTDM